MASTVQLLRGVAYEMWHRWVMRWVWKTATKNAKTKTTHKQPTERRMYPMLPKLYMINW